MEEGKNTFCTENPNILTIAAYLEIASGEDSKPDPEILKREYQELLKSVRKTGYEKVDLTSLEIQSIGLEVLKGMLETAGLSTASCIWFEELSEILRDLPACVKRAEAGVEEAKELGAKILMFGPMDSGTPEPVSAEEIRDALTEYLRCVCQLAKEAGLTPVIENIPDPRASLRRIRDVRSMMDEVPDLNWIFDTGTAYLEDESPEEFLETLKDRLVYVHLKDMKKEQDGAPARFPAKDGTGCVNALAGTGEAELKQTAACLQKIGYTGECTDEFCPEEGLSTEEALQKSRNYIITLLKGKNKTT